MVATNATSMDSSGVDETPAQRLHGIGKKQRRSCRFNTTTATTSTAAADLSRYLNRPKRKGIPSDDLFILDHSTTDATPVLKSLLETVTQQFMLTTDESRVAKSIDDTVYSNKDVYTALLQTSPKYLVCSHDCLPKAIARIAGAQLKYIPKRNTYIFEGANKIGRFLMIIRHRALLSAPAPAPPPVKPSPKATLAMILNNDDAKTTTFCVGV
eukprot:483104-Rhodomonas_salina.3